jgi:putative endonuclease
MDNWSVYIILCSDNSLYTGITNNVMRRFEQHKTHKGAKFFYSRKPLKIVFCEYGHTRSSAAKREVAIKQLKRSEKLALIAASAFMEINA